MPIFSKGDARIAFIHIPKTGGTSIERHFEAHGWQMEYWSGVRDGGHSVSDQHLLYQDLATRVQNLDQLPSFTIVRHPIRRFISEWRWQRWEMRNISCDLSTFIEQVEQSLRTDPVYWDNHWRPQVDFLAPPIDHVIKLEEIDFQFPLLIERLRLDLPPTLPKDNVSSRGFRNWFRRPSQVKLSQFEIDRLRKVYAADFEALGYE